MTHILVTGAAGTLGKAVVNALAKTGLGVRGMSRRERPADFPTDGEWAQADLETGVGLQEAVKGVEVVIHAASNPVAHTWATDVDGTRRLLEQARMAGVRHFIYVSIIGIEKIPYGYYKAKVAAETLVRESGVPYTILRAAQFPELLDTMLGMLERLGPILPVPTDFQFQLIDVATVAAALVKIAQSEPAGEMPEIAGPEVTRLGDMARCWLKMRGQRRLIVSVWVPGKVGQGFRRGYNTSPDHRQGNITWADWLTTKYGMKNDKEEAS